MFRGQGLAGGAPLAPQEEEEELEKSNNNATLQYEGLPGATKGSVKIPTSVTERPSVERTGAKQPLGEPKEDALAQGQSLLRAGRYLEVLAWAGERGTTHDRAWATLRYGAHVRLKQFNQALMELQLRVEMNPLDVEAYQLMGMIHLQHNRSLSQARAAFSAALSLSPGSPVAKSGLSACALTKERETDENIK